MFLLILLIQYVFNTNRIDELSSSLPIHFIFEILREIGFNLEDARVSFFGFVVVVVLSVALGFQGFAAEVVVVNQILNYIIRTICFFIF